ncbi:MAG: ferrous iron transporter B [Clostridia bacterium]|nr:ferrous iron transporter B [Clostridia bacterium]
MRTFALAGNPNCGKTTLFNALTGSTAHVGNWPGVTVDKKDGLYKSDKETVAIIDLPGIYSLSPYTPEEVIARNYILDEHPDGIINIVDATNLERNLYLTTQILEMDVPVIVALNFMDEVEKAGDRIDPKVIESALGVPVVPVSALTGKGIKELMERAISMPAKREGTTVLQGTIDKPLEPALEYYRAQEVSSPLFHAIKLLEADEIEVERKGAKAVLAEATAGQAEGEEDLEAVIADERYKYISARLSGAKVKAMHTLETRSDKIDKVLTHRVWAIPIFLVILLLLFHLTFSDNLFFLNGFTEKQHWMPTLFDPVEEGGLGWEETWSSTLLACFYDGTVFSPGVILANIFTWITDYITEGVSLLISVCNGAAWIDSLVCDAVLGGIFAVLGFLPQILLLFLGFSILEDTGYMARIAFVLDRIFRRFGLSGRAFMPMIMGFGCGLPAIINTRTLADEKERTATIRVIPFFSCGAKLPILTGMAGAMVSAFGFGNADLITYAMYLVGIVTALVCVILMRNTTLKGDTPPFIMELPAYHFPKTRNLMIHIWDKAKHFVKKAFTIIFLSTIVIWFLQSFSWRWEFLLQDTEDLVNGVGLTASQKALTAADANYFVNMFTDGSGNLLVEGMVNLRTDESILGSLGMLLQPIFTPLGFGSQAGELGWVFAVAAITGLVAKENVVATFGALAAVVAATYIDTEANGAAACFAMVANTDITWQGVIAFIVFNMTTIPCFASCATARAELPKGKFKWTLLFWFATSYIVSACVYTVLSWWWTLFIWLAVLAIAVTFIVLNNHGKLDRLKIRRRKKNGPDSGESSVSE